MNLPDIKAFIAFAETGSINRAALRLGLTQPATTRRIQNFEALMAGTSLLDRRVKPAVLTPAGRRVLAHCQRVLKAVAELEACGASHTNPTGQFRIGLSPGLAEIVLSTTLDGLRERFPDLQLRVTSEWTSQLIRKVADCDLDCAIAFVTDHHTLPSMVSSTVIGVETLVVVAARTFDTPRRNGKSVRIRDLELIRLDREPCWVRISRNFAACLRSNKRIMPLCRRCPGIRSASVVGRERSGAWPRSKPTRQGQSAAAQISYYHSKRFPTGGQSDAAARNGAWKSLAGRQSP